MSDGQGKQKPTERKEARNMESKQKRMSWSEGWHEIHENFRYFVENGCLVRGVSYGKNVSPYLKNARFGGYDNASGIAANKRNYDRVYWF